MGDVWVMFRFKLQSDTQDNKICWLANFMRQNENADCIGHQWIEAQTFSRFQEAINTRFM